MPVIGYLVLMFQHLFWYWIENFDQNEIVINCRRWNLSGKNLTGANHSWPWSWKCNEFDRIYFEINQWYCHPSKLLSHKDFKLLNLKIHFISTNKKFSFLNEIQNFLCNNICDTSHAMCDREHNWSGKLDSRKRF